MSTTSLISNSPMLVAILSGGFNIFVALASIFINFKISKSNDRRKLLSEKYQQKRDLFSEILYQISGLIQEVDFGDENKDKTRIDKIHRAMSILKLISAQPLIDDISCVLENYNEYVIIHFRNKPRKVGGMVLISSNDKPDFVIENQKQQILTESIRRLTEQFKSELLKL